MGHFDVALAQPFDIVRCQKNLYPVVDIEPFGMVIHLLGQERDPGHEGPGLAESAKMKGLADGITIFDLDPAAELGDRFFTLRPDQPFPPSLADLETMAQQALETIPAELKQHLGAVVIRLEDFPDDETIDTMELESPFDILGLYRGVALPQQSVMATRADIDMIFLYRRPILDYWCETGDDLSEVVRHVLIHEIGHHFGFSDEDMERIERDS
jgi:predicted Zn-dependent protease with MMP-like domain